MSNTEQSGVILYEENSEAFCIETIRFAQHKGFNVTLPNFDGIIETIEQDDSPDIYEELYAGLMKECNLALAYLNSIESRHGYAWMTLHNGETWELRLINFNDRCTGCYNSMNLCTCNG